MGYYCIEDLCVLLMNMCFFWGTVNYWIHFHINQFVLMTPCRPVHLQFVMQAQIIIDILGQYHGCWCPGPLHFLVISSHDIDYACNKHIPLFFMMKDFNYMCHLSGNEWYKCHYKFLLLQHVKVWERHEPISDSVSCMVNMVPADGQPWYWLCTWCSA